MSDTSTAIQRHHHITLCVGGAQEDYDFHTKVLGLKSVKKTALYDGDVPIYHLYYGNDTGHESTLVTSFPMRQSGRVGRRGTNQTKVLMLSVPDTALDYWRRRLGDCGFDVTETEVFGEKRLRFCHPCGIEYELVGVVNDDRPAHSAGPVPAQVGVHGTHGITVSVRSLDLSADFMTAGWSGRLTQEEGDRARFEVGEGGSGRIVDFVAEPQLDQAGWMYGEGIVHHTAFQVADYDVQSAVKSHLEGIGFTDVSERKDRGYFESIYVRTPGGALFEATVSKPEGFLIDEPYEELGTKFQVPPQFAGQREFLISYLEPLEY
ncbi:MAG TPA: hydroxyquinol 1,2-dioxygenase [Acidimicrobiales bacterium]|nr:hydroxyquinol 1,2-dioxygenase [Acidimicrobiales bacterium]